MNGGPDFQPEQRRANRRQNRKLSGAIGRLRRKTRVRTRSSPLVKSRKRTLLFMLTTSCGIASGASICARSSSSFRASATGELAYAGCSSSLSIRSASNSLIMIAGLVIAYPCYPNLFRKENPRRKGQGLMSLHHTETCLMFEVIKRTFSASLAKADEMGASLCYQEPTLSSTNCLAQLPGCGCGRNESAPSGALIALALMEICISVK